MCVCVILIYLMFSVQFTVSFSVLLIIGVFSLLPWREESLLFIVREAVTVK